MSTPLPQLPIGRVIGGRYRIQSLIGRGGMGMVYAATHELTGRRVAVKLVLPDADESPLLKERLLSEARIAAAVVHPNIVDVLDMGVHDGVLFLVMELLEGISLERLLETQTRLTPEQTFSWLLPIMGALATLHDAGIVHRDVKPSNIFLSSLPRHPVKPKLLDFGLARVVSDLRLTRSGTVIGTPLYMAPEHAAGHVTGPQADVWSLGVVVFECLAGVSPFSFTDRSSLAAQVLAGLVRPLQELRPDLPPALGVVVGRALQRDLGRRYSDMRAFAQALYAAGIASGVPMPRDPDPVGLPDYARDVGSAAAAATTVEHGTGPRLAPHARASGTQPSELEVRRPASRWLLSLLLVLVASLTVLVGYAFWPGARRQQPLQAPTAAGETSLPVREAQRAAPSPVAPSVEPLPNAPSTNLVPPRDAAAEQAEEAAKQGAARRQTAEHARRRKPATQRSNGAKSERREEKARPKSVDEVESEWK